MGSFDRVRGDIKYPERTTARYKRLDALERLLTGDFYEHLRYDFYKEKNGRSSVPITQRRPSQTYNLAEMLVNDTTSLLFTQEHSPYAKCWDAAGDGANADGDGGGQYDATEKCIETIRAEYNLDATMLEASYTGSVGSVALVVRQLPTDGKVFIEIVKGKECWPVYDPTDPSKLKKLVREYPIRGWDLIGAGYQPKTDDRDENGIDPEAWYFMRIELDDHEEAWYFPMIEKKYVDMKKAIQDAPKWVRDDERSWEHEFKGICPAVFIRNTTQKIKYGDGEATYGKVADLIVELDYLLSQISRGFRYSMDPWLLLNKGLLGDLEPLGSDIGGIIGDQSNAVATESVDLSQSNALVLPKDGKAEFIEINGQGLTAGSEFLKLMREWAIEVVGGMKSDQEHSGGTQSGKALEILHKKLIWLIERLRICYGDRGYVPLLRIMLVGVDKGIVQLKGFQGKVDIDAPIRLEWPRWNKPDGAELLDIISAFQLAIGGSQKAPLPIMDTELAAAFVAMAAGETDPVRAVKKFMKSRDQQVQHMGDVAKAMQPPPPPKPPGQADK